MNIRKIKKYLLIAVIAGIVLFTGLVILVVMTITWLFNRGGEQIQTAGANVAEQAQQFTSPLNLASYINGNSVDTAQLEQIFRSLPDQLQAPWLDQFNSQLQDLQNQAGVSDEAIRTLTNLYNSLSFM